MLLVPVYRDGVSTEIRRNGGVSRLSSDISVAKSSSAFQHWADAPPAQVAETLLFRMLIAIVGASQFRFN